MNVKELMTTNICFLKDDAMVSDAIQLMKTHDLGIVPICDSKGELHGIVTDRDILLKCLSDDGIKLGDSKISDIMTATVSSISCDMNIHDAALEFSKLKLRRLPVVDGTRLVGMLSITDLAKKRVFLAEVGDILGSIAKK